MKFITDSRIHFGLLSSPKPVLFRREFNADKKVIKAELRCTAWGIYYAELNGKKIGDIFLAPGFTSYQKHLQYQVYDITSLMSEKNVLDITVSGGWAVGRFGLFPWRSKNYERKPALWFELKLEYEDGTLKKIESDENCLVGRNSYEKASIYNGEVFDARISAYKFKRADLYKPKLIPDIIEGGPYVTAHESFSPVSVTKSEKGYIYDFGQNMAGVISAKMTARAGQKITILHAEILKDGKLFRKPLRTAKAKVIYIAKNGSQKYMPQMTYMGFRYIEVIGIEPENIELTAVALYSDIKQIGKFECCNELINKLQSSIEWGAKSNFVDIPTDCPQRDERMGWTADTAVFASTACFNFGMRDMYEKWLLALRDDQGANGQIPDVVPRVKMNGKRSAPVWADATAIVPFASYMAYGDVSTLEKQYSSICRYIEDGKSHLTDFVWDKGFQYGDWCAPNAKMSTWKKRGKYVGTCYFANSVNIASKIADILGKESDKQKYEKLFLDICGGFERRFVNADGSIIDEFQSAYVLPLYFNMLPKYHDAFASNLARLVKDADYHLTTGFAGTPYILFALSDNGHLSLAYKVLMQDTCPSWLYEIKAGATTMWERWDALRPDGSVAGANTMVSFNHYAYGAVGDFLYRRVVGIEALEAGYKAVRIAPKIGGDLKSASASTQTPFGTVSVSWKIDDGKFYLKTETPDKIKTEIVMPSGKKYTDVSGTQEFTEPLQ